MNLTALDEHELELIRRLHAHPYFQALEAESPDTVRASLLQRRFVSLAFTPMYDAALDGLRDERAIRVTRELLREEYPAREPSHRELLAGDLLAIGVARDTLLTATPTPQTRDFLERSFSLLKMDTDPDLHEIKILAIIRLWGEVLVSEEYRCLAPAFERLGLSAASSRFYWPHRDHDERKTSFASGRSTGSHSDWLTVILRDLLDSSSKIEFLSHIHEEVFALKYNFWSQFSEGRQLFIPSPTAPREQIAVGS